MRFYKYIFAFLSLNVLISAQKLSRNEIETAAAHWFENYSFLLVPKPVNDNVVPNLEGTREIFEDGNPVAFIVPLYPKGFIIFSADKMLKPALGYSTEFNFSFYDSPDNFFLDILKQDISLRKKYLADNDYPRKDYLPNIKKWNLLLSGKIAESELQSVNREIIGPFVQSDWGQGYVNGEAVFNYYSPNNWPTGCVATAMAQILNYYKWPIRGYGSHSYTDNNTGYHSVNYYDTFYDWENTLDFYEGVLFNSAQQRAAGLLTYHTAVSLNMDFEPDGSTAETADSPTAFRNYFRCSAHYSSKNSSGFWTAMKNNMYDYRPAILSIKRSDGSGHAAVVSGYSEANGYYHLNPGWYGSQSGWYDISGSWNMDNYTIVIGAAKGIVPNPMINIDIDRIDSLNFYLSWSVSRHQDAQYYQLQQALSSGGPWTTLSSNIIDTIYAVSVSSIGNYYYRVRARRDDIWWDYSKVKKVQLGSDREIEFRVNMSERPLLDGETVGVRGNLPPLGSLESYGPMTDNDGQGIYSITVPFDYDNIGKTLIYRFAVDSDSGDQVETKNREYIITSDIVQTLPAVYFDDITAVETGGMKKTFAFDLRQNYPNPFNPSTQIDFTLPEQSLISLTVYNSLGEEAVKIIDNETYGAGKNSLIIDFSEYGLTSGIYYLKLNSNINTKTIKMIFLK